MRCNNLSENIGSNTLNIVVKYSQSTLIEVEASMILSDVIARFHTVHR